MSKMEWKLFFKKIKKLAAYKSDFIIGIMASLCHGIVALIFITSYYRLVPDIAGWMQEQVVYMYFSVSFMQSWFQCLYSGMIGFSQNYVKTGDLDAVLVKPINELRYIILYDINIGELPIVVLNFAILLLAILNLNVSVWEALILICMPFLGTQIMYSISLMINCLSFRFVDTLMGVKFLISITDINRYPVDIYPDALSVVFKFVLPFSVVVFFPVIGNVVHIFLIAILVMVVFHVIAHKVWRYQLGKYCGTGT